MILQPDEETLARYRHEAEEHRIAGGQARDAPRSAGRDGRRRAHRAAGQHRVSLRGRPLRRSRRPTASACTAPSSCISARETSRPRRSISRPTRASSQAMGGQPVVIRTFDLGADKMPDMPAPEDERNPFLGLAQHPPGAAEPAAVPHAVAGDPAGQRRWATCRSCSRWSPRCWSCGRPRWCWPT